MIPPAAPPLKFVARVAPVKEVTLHGTADLRYWRKRLMPEGLEPVEANGMAQLFVSATEARFWGLLFREALIGVQVIRPGREREPVAGMFLVQAWNSLSAFAWVERTMFHTPYEHGQIEVDPRSPAQLQVAEHRKTLLDAKQAAPREPLSTADETWQGPIFLPIRAGRAPQLFIAQLNGPTEHHLFKPEHDSFAYATEASHVAIQSLRESNFTPTRWHLRQAASHAKSKTYRVADWFGDEQNPPPSPGPDAIRHAS
jgi:hypothetical protein